MKKKKINRIIILILLFFIGLNYINLSYAKIEPDQYKPNVSDNGTKLVNLGNKIIGVIQWIGSIVSVIVLIVIGIKYMLGSVEEKAQYKKEFVPYIIGAIMLFSIVNLLKIIEKIMQ